MNTYYTPKSLFTVYDFQEGTGEFLNNIINDMKQDVLLETMEQFKGTKEDAERELNLNAKINPDYTLTRPKRLNKFEKVNGMKVVKSDYIAPEKMGKPKIAGAPKYGRSKAEKRLKFESKNVSETITP